MRTRTKWLCIVLAAIPVFAEAQWLHHPVPGTPRTKDGQPNLSAPAPRASNGKPDLSGVWQPEPSPIPDLLRLIPGGQNGLGEALPTKYFLSILADFKPGEEPLRNRPSAPLTFLFHVRTQTPATCLDGDEGEERA